MTKHSLITSLLFMAALGAVSANTFAQSDASGENTMADDILGDMPPESSVAPPSSGAPGAGSSDDAMLGTPEAPIDLTGSAPPEEIKNDAFNRLDALKMTRTELAAFMKGGGIKSRLMKEQK